MKKAWHYSLIPLWVVLLVLLERRISGGISFHEYSALWLFGSFVLCFGGWWTSQRSANLLVFGAIWGPILLIPILWAPQSQPIWGAGLIGLFSGFAFSLWSELPLEFPGRPKLSEAAVSESQEGAEPLIGEGENSLSQFLRFDRGEEEGIRGTFWAQFAENQKVAVLQIPFVPSFEQTPRIECFVAEDVGVRCRITSSYPHGVRIEARRGTGPLSEARVPILIHAQSRTSSLDSQ